MPRKALTDDQRHARRATLLAAAQTLYRHSGQLPTVAQIAEAAGVAKGSVYLSFRTKEAIFIALLEDSFDRLLAGLLPLLRAMPAEAEAAASHIAPALSAYLAEQRELLSLAGMANAVLEQNLPLAEMLAFKRRLALGLAQAGAVLEMRTPRLAGRGAAFLLQTWGLCIGLWQALDAHPGLVALRDEPDLAILRLDFRAELCHALDAMWFGALAPR
ncbi:MAG: TetR family transcriptional regulator [Paludibacterium sp.]|uniref:TetR family transcriptional regulator n=1 Tax=Paludibacterium sp. TaxID=1917523 RepID=UPI0025FCEE15|nr:TetR family transcriptional regulator [Paludibacterium sp.]MBV8049263.1 TetR family transcriptional regulator [Paludibacterium sp.]MBV8648277.1 TetR family transcriptional regulator [Paludibacterium sp.]